MRTGSSLLEDGDENKGTGEKREGAMGNGMGSEGLVVSTERQPEMGLEVGVMIHNMETRHRHHGEKERESISKTQEL